MCWHRKAGEKIRSSSLFFSLSVMRGNIVSHGNRRELNKKLIISLISGSLPLL